MVHAIVLDSLARDRDASIKKELTEQHRKEAEKEKVKHRKALENEKRKKENWVFAQKRKMATTTTTEK